MSAMNEIRPFCELCSQQEDLVSGAKLAPQGRLRKAQGASPGNKDSNNGSPEGAMQWVPVPKTCLMTSIYLEFRPNSLRRPFRSEERRVGKECRSRWTGSH